LQQRSTKKFKDDGQQTKESAPSQDAVGADAGVTGEGADAIKSYKEMVMGTEIRVDSDMEDSEKEGEDDANGEEGEGMRVEEIVLGKYACPEFLLSKSEEKRIYRPWKRGIIVKLLGRRIGYKALETRLKQMWVKKGVINIIDLSNDYYLVTFTHDDDHYTTLMNGPWFIYDHYLTVKAWSPNFHPQSDTIKNVAVWVRISGLPIEYYDAKVYWQ
jgi:hypothetical protein